MTTMRLLPAMLLTATLASTPASAQFGPRSGGYPDHSQPGVGPGFPSVQPNVDSGATMNSVERVSMRSVPGAPPADPGASTLPFATTQPGGYPPGPYPGPALVDRAGCAGPVGGDGPITYELYGTTGPNWVGGSDLTDRLNPGWSVGGGGRTLLFNPSATAAWAFDLGLSYTYNRGREDDVLFAFNNGTSTTDIFGNVTTTPPSIQGFQLRSLNRTSFNYAIGRDWWIWGPGAAGYESGWNIRWGLDIGGRWGTAHVDMVPTNDPGGYFRRQATYTGLFLDLHSNWEVPVGGCIWFGGLKLQYGYDWMDILPPLDTNISNVNLLLTSGIRF